MSAQANIERMAAFYAAYGKGDAEPFFASMAEDGVIRYAAPPKAYPFAAPRRGPEGAREAVALIAAEYQWLSFHNVALISEGDWVVGVSGGRLRHRASGRETDLQLGDLVHFRDGRIIEFVEFFDTAGTLDWSEGGSGQPACSVMNPAHKATACAPGIAEHNKALIAGIYDAYRRKEAGPLLALLAEDAIYNAVANQGDFRFAGPCHGREAFAGNVAAIAEDYELERYDVLQMVAQDELVAVHADVAFRHRGARKLAESEKLDLFRLRDGRIVEFNEFFDTLSARGAHEAPKAG